MELVGRDRELAAVGRAIEEVRDGSSRVLGVLGEAGLGKSALLAAIGERSRDAGLLVLDGRGVEHERGVPFGVALDALGDHGRVLPQRTLDAHAPELASALPTTAVRTADAAERVRHHRALRTLIELLGHERPVALLLDDLHWADEPSVELVLLLLRRPPPVAHLLAFALRPAGPAPRLLDAARGAPGWAQLALDPLGHEDALDLLAGVADAGARERIANEARGNPLFLRELARVAHRRDGTLPPTLIAAVGLEVAALEPTARALIEGAAVAGDPFDPELAAAAAGLPAGAILDALDLLVAADLVRARADAPARAFYVPPPAGAARDLRRRSARLAAGRPRRVAAALALRGAGAGARAYHVERFAHPGGESAIALLCEAAEASAGASPAAAAHWYAAALPLLPETDRRRRAALLAPMAVALGSAGRLEDSREAFVEALGLLSPEHGPQRLELVTACAQVEPLLGRYADGRRRLVAALAQGPREGRAGLAFELAVSAFSEGRRTELQEWTEPAAREAAEAREPLMLAGAEALGAQGALWVAEPERAGALLDRATARLSALDDETIAARPMVAVYVGVPQLLAERFADAAATSDRALAVSRRTGTCQALVPLLTISAMARLHLLELDAALPAAETAEEIARLQGVPRLVHFALWIRALVHEERGEAAEAERAADECAALVRGLEPSNMTRTGTCNLAALRADHDPRRAIREIVATAGPELQDAEPTRRSWLLLRLVRAAIAPGALADADDWARRAAQLWLPAGAVRATCARAEVLLAARAHAVAGDTARAKTALQQVAVDAGRGGAQRLHDAAARELRRLGSRLSAHARRAVPARHTSLTQREHDIAELVSQGLSNKQIAARLYLSEKTIENTLTRIYAKLSVRSRVQLTRMLIHS